MPVNEKKILSLMGLAARSGNIVSGEFMSEKSVKEGKACLVIVAADASENTKKNFRNACEYYKVPVIEISNKEALGHCIGKMFRASSAITDPGFAKAILKLMQEND